MIAGKRALAASVVVGGVLVFAVGGLQSPDAGSMIKVSITGFFIFWIVFAFLFRPTRATDRTADGHPHYAEGRPLRNANSWLRGDVQSQDVSHHSGSDADMSHGDSAGGDSGH